jgi:flagellar biosynthesis protein FlhB
MVCPSGKDGGVGTFVKQHPPTAKKLRESSKKGETKSLDLVMPLVEITLIGAVVVKGLSGAATLNSMVVSWSSSIHYGDAFVQGGIFSKVIDMYIRYTICLVCLAVAAIAVKLLCDPCLIQGARLRMRNPLSGSSLSKYLSGVKAQGLTLTIRSIVLLTATSSSIALLVPSMVRALVSQEASLHLSSLWFPLSLWCGLATIGGIGHVLIRSYRFRRSLFMTTAELKEELREEFGDPWIRSHRDALRHRAVHEDLEERIKKASVVVVSSL